MCLCLPACLAQRSTLQFTSCDCPTSTSSLPPQPNFPRRDSRPTQIHSFHRRNTISPQQHHQHETIHPGPHTDTLSCTAPTSAVPRISPLAAVAATVLYRYRPTDRQRQRYPIRQLLGAPTTLLRCCQFQSTPAQSSIQPAPAPTTHFARPHACSLAFSQHQTSAPRRRHRIHALACSDVHSLHVASSTRQHSTHRTALLLCCCHSCYTGCLVLVRIRSTLSALRSRAGANPLIIAGRFLVRRSISPTARPSWLAKGNPGATRHFRTALLLAVDNASRHAH
jgi:hypothetical protein